MQLLSACGERERVDGIFDLVPLDEALRWSLCWSSREGAGQRAAASWRGRTGAAARLLRVGLGLGLGLELGLR